MMRRMIICTILTIFLVAGTSKANTIASSTMYFQGSLTVDASGAYTGTIDAVKGTYYIPGGPGSTLDGSAWVNPDGTPSAGGFDVYAQEGGTAYYDDSVQGIIGADHDAYSSAGGWGAFWDPDVPDWYHYQLTLTEDSWFLEYKGDALGTPMSGVINWNNMIATETGTGQYRGTVPSDPDANDGDAAANGGGAQAWDMDWTWGSEVIPLEYPYFQVNVTYLAGIDQYKVSLTPTPVPLPGAVLLGILGLGVAGIKLRKHT